MSKLNCWEYKHCGRENGGVKVAELGVCPAALELRTNSLNGGKNGGRACWALAGTLCGGQIQGTFSMKLGNCLKCEFYQLVATEEGPKLESTKAILSRLR